MSKTTNKISVIIPCKNRIKFVIEAIKSAINQNLDNKYNIEIIVIDDASIKPLKPILFAEFGVKVKVLRNTISKGPGASRNMGLKLAKGDYIAFLDSDDSWSRNFLTTSINKLNDTKSVATVCLTKPYFYGSFPIYNKIKLVILNVVKYIFVTFSAILNNGFLPKSAFYLCQISHQLFDGKSIKNLHFNEESAAAEDWEFLVDCTLIKPVAIIIDPLVHFRYEAKSNSFTPLVKAKKESAYKDLLKKLPKSHKKFPFYSLFELYIKYFLVK